MASPEEKENAYRSARPREKVSYQEESDGQSQESDIEAPLRKSHKRQAGVEKEAEETPNKKTKVGKAGALTIKKEAS